MDMLKNPLRQDLPIPWAKIKDLGARDLEADSGTKLEPSKKPRVTRVEGRIQNVQAKRSRMGELTAGNRNEKRKKVQTNHIHGMDDGEDVTVKMEEMHFQVSIKLH